MVGGGLIDEIEGEPLSTREIRRMVGPKVPVIPYSSLRNYSSLDQLVGDHGAIILYRSSPTYGHWVALTPGPRFGDVSYYDSYGRNVDVYLKKLSKDQAIELGQDVPYLAHLIDEAFNSGQLRMLHTNTKAVQSRGDMATCGRYAALRVIYKNLSHEDFNQMIGDKEGGGTVYDRNVALMTALI